MLPHGFLRVAAACPVLRVADCPSNADRILDQMAEAERQGVDVLVFPELALTGYTCADLFQHPTLQRGALEALARAVLLLNLSASNEVIGKAAYRKQLVVNQSGRCMAAYAYASCGVHESTTDVVFGGHCLIAENGALLAESKRFERQPTLTVADVDLERLRADRIRTNSFGDAALYVPLSRPFERVRFRLR